MVSMIKNKPSLRYCPRQDSQLFPYNAYCILSFPQFISHNISYGNIKTSKLCIENRICQKQNSLWWSEQWPYFYNAKNSEKLGQRKKFVSQLPVTISEFFDAPVKSGKLNTGGKSFCFCTELNQQVSTLSQRFYLALYWKKTYKTWLLQ